MADRPNAVLSDLQRVHCSSVRKRVESPFVFGEMPDYVFRLGRSIRLEPKTYASLETGPNGFVWLIREGWFFGLRAERDGRLKTGELIGPRDLFGVTGMWSITSTDLPLYTLTTVKLVQVKTKVFEGLCERDRGVGDAFMRYMIARYRRMVAELHRSTLLPLAPRIESFLGYVDSRARDCDGTPPPRLSESILALAVGAHPVSVCRAMREVNQRGATGV